MRLRAFRFPLVLTAGVALFSSAANAYPQARSPDIESLRDALLGLSTTVSKDEAMRVSARAHQAARDLKREYRIVGPPQFHNFLVNVGIKDRGLCHQWTRDLMEQLSALDLETLELHWGIARAGTLREHNTVVVTAKRQPFASGIVLDPWRRSRRLYVGRVEADRYPWREDVRDCLCERRWQHSGPVARGRSEQSPLSSARATLIRHAELRLATLE